MFYRVGVDSRGHHSRLRSPRAHTHVTVRPDPCNVKRTIYEDKQRTLGASLALLITISLSIYGKLQRSLCSHLSSQTLCMMSCCTALGGEPLPGPLAGVRSASWFLSGLRVS